jgi:transposase, IS5 family
MSCCAAESAVILLRLRQQENDMSRRRIGQEGFGFAQGERGRNGRLDAIARAIDWAPVDRLLKDIHAAAKGEPAWPPLALFKALLLGFWYDLSDVALAEALDDRASFRRFCGFSAGEATPERTAFVRFRRALVARGLDAKLFAAVVRQIEAQGLAVRTGTLVDATVVRQAARTDGEADWCVYGGPRRTPVKGYKAHVAADEAGGIVRKVVVTPANVHDAQGLEPVLPARPGRVWADSAYDSRASHARVRAKGGVPRIARRIDKRIAAAKAAAMRAWNRTVASVRCRVEKIFGTAKRSYGLGRARYVGLARVSLQVHLTFLAYNLTRACNLLRASAA